MGKIISAVERLVYMLSVVYPFFAKEKLAALPLHVYVNINRMLCCTHTIKHIFESHLEKTNNVVTQHIQHKSSSTSTEDS